MEARQKEYLKVRGVRRVRRVSCQIPNEKRLTPEELHVRGLKAIPYDVSVTEPHAWLVDSLARSHPGGEE